ncbi:MAG: ABC transporter permease, partial [Candidatus Eremiobacterota bacterium]
MKKQKGNIIDIIVPIIAVIMALVVGSIFIAISGRGIIASYMALLYGAFGSKASIAETLVKTVPLIFCGLSVAFA